LSIIRAFIAIDLSPEIQHQLSDVLEKFKTQLATLPIRWVGAANIHLTLKFLGDVSLSNLKLLTDMIKSEVSSHHQFEISIGGAGAFPNNRQPRVIWVGVEGPQELLTIQNGIESAAARLGYVKEDRSFSPHLTLGRISRNATSHDIKLISQILDKTRIGFLGATCVDQVHLYRSDLQRAGAVYTKIFSTPLQRQITITR
jgi:RNA 2',3'-cyclic 3'-phosphodiesterase